MGWVALIRTFARARQTLQSNPSLCWQGLVGPEKGRCECECTGENLSFVSVLAVYGYLHHMHLHQLPHVMGCQHL